MKRRQINLTVRPDVFRAFREICEDEWISMSRKVEEMMIEFIDLHDSQQDLLLADKDIKKTKKGK